MKTYLLRDINDELWEKFKATITKDKKIRDILIEMIKKRVEEYDSNKC